ncbi:MAG: recombinase family protein [Candidatus Peregrinibacteria bacterium]
MKVYAYLRKSTEGDENQIHSLTTQRRIVEDFANKKGLQIDEYIEEEKTGFKAGVRKKFNAMMRDCTKTAKKGEEAHIIFWKVSRIGRNRKDADLALDAMEAGVHFHFTEGDFPDNATGRKILRDKLSDAIYYSEDLSENVKDGQETSISKGLFPGSSKLGYLTRPDPTKPRTINPDEAWKIREAFERISHGEKMKEVVEWLQKSVYLKTYGGRVACRNTLYNLFHDPFYCGKFLWNGKIYEGTHEPIISKELFTTVQEILEGNRIPKVQKHIFLFLGMVFSDGEKLSCSKNRENYYYRSKKTGLHLREEEIEKSFIEMLQETNMKASYIEEMRERAKNMLGIRNEQISNTIGIEMAKVSAIQNRMKNAEDLLLDGKIPYEKYQEMVERLKKEQASILEAIPQKNTKSEDEKTKILHTVIERIQIASRSYETLPKHLKSQFITAILSSVEHSTNSGKLGLKPKKATQSVFELPFVQSGCPGWDRTNE